MMKNFRDYLSEAEHAADTPVPGDTFAINIREECLIESVVIESRSDGVLIAADEGMISLLESYGYTFEQTCQECGINEGECGCVHEQTELAESHFAVGDRVQCRQSGMKGRVVKLDKEHGAEDDQYYTVKRDDGTLKKMAPGDMTKIDEQVQEFKDELQQDQDANEYDQEGDMAKTELQTMIRSARRLQGLLGDDDNMPEWTQKKITKATDYVDTAADYIASQKERGIMERFAEDPGKLDLTANPTKSQVFARYMSIYDYDGYAGEENEQEMQNLEDYAEQRFGPDTVNDMTSAGYYSYFGRADDPKKPIDQGSGNYTGLGRSPVSARDIKKSGTLNKRATAGTKDRILSRLGKHPKPALPESAEEKESNPVARAILHRIMMQHTGMLAQHGPEQVMNAVDDVAEYIGDVEEIGSSDVSAYVRQVEQMLGGLREQGVAEGSLNEAATMASVSKLLRHIERHHPNWFDDYGMGEVEDTVVDMAEQGQFSGMTVVDAAALVGQELESLYGADGMNEGSADLTDIWQAGREAAYSGKSMMSCPHKMFSKEWDAWQQGWQDQKGSTSDGMNEAEYQGRKVQLGKKMKGDVKKSKVYVKNPQGNVVKVNFGDPNMKIRKSNPGARKSFRARHNCDNPGPRTSARYWSCRSW